MPQPPNAQIVKKLKELSEIAEALRQGNDFPITRLTTIKSLCSEPEEQGPGCGREALKSVLKRSEAPIWANQAAKDYAERYDGRFGSGLIPSSAPMVQEIAGFWRDYYDIKENGRVL